MKNKVYLAACLGFVGLVAAASSPLEISGDTVVNEDCTVSAIVFTGGYRLSGSGKITIDSAAGITVNEGIATIENEVAFAAGDVEVVCTVGDAGVLVQKGEWSGSSPLQLVGQGYSKSTHRFELHGANTFTGTLTLLRARVDAYSGGAFGTEDNGTTWIADGADGSLVNLYGGEYTENFSVSKFANAWKSWWRSVASAPGSTNIISSAVALGSPSYYRGLESSLTVFNGGSIYSAGVMSFQLDGNAVVAISNEVNLSCVTFDVGGDGSGTVYLGAARKGGWSSNKEYEIKAKLVMLGENRFNCMNTRGGLVTASGVIDLNGYDQNGGACRGGAVGGVITSLNPAVWHVDMGDYSTENANSFEGAVSLEKKGNGKLTLSGVSSTTGTLFVVEGDVTMAASGEWAGSFEVQSGTLTLVGTRQVADTRAIIVNEGAKIILDGGTLTAENVFVGGQKLAPGIYSAAGGSAFLGGSGTLIVINREVEPETVVWTGNGSDLLMTTVANWAGDRESAPDFAQGKTTAVFAESGSRAEVAEPISLSGIVFRPCQEEGSFVLGVATESASLAVGEDGIRIEDADVKNGSYEFEIPVTSGCEFSIVGEGDLYLRNGGILGGAVFVTNANVHVSGTLNLGAGLKFIPKPEASGKAELCLSNAVLVGSSQIELYGKNLWYPLVVGCSSTNRVENSVKINNTSRPRFGRGSRTVFAGACRWGEYTVLHVEEDSSIVFENTLSAYDFNTSGTGATIEFLAKSNRFDGQDRWGCRMCVADGILVKTGIAGALDLARQALLVNGVLDLCGYDQTVGPLAGSGEVTSPSLASLTVTQCTRDKTTYSAPLITGPYTNAVSFTGGAGILKKGEHALYLGAESSSTGSLEVAEGVLTFADGGTWPNCSQVRISGTGQMVVPRSKCFNREADVYLSSGTGATMEIVAGVSVRCRYVYLDGVRQGLGRFNAATHPDYLAGEGDLRAVGGGLGLFMIIR